MPAEILYPQIFADSANIEDLDSFYGFIRGITTNPTIVAEQGNLLDPDNHFQMLVKRYPDLPVSLQLLDKPFDELLEDADKYRSMGNNVVIKVPMFSDGRGLRLIPKLAERNIPVNVTALMKTEQIALALAAGDGLRPDYVSLFFNRIRDGGGNPTEEIKRTRDLIDSLNSSTLIITGSIRGGQDVIDAMASKAHIITVQPKHLWEMIGHFKTSEFINQSQEAWEKLIAKRNGRQLTEENLLVTPR